MCFSSKFLFSPEPKSPSMTHFALFKLFSASLLSRTPANLARSSCLAASGFKLWLARINSHSYSPSSILKAQSTSAPLFPPPQMPSTLSPFLNFLRMKFTMPAAAFSIKSSSLRSNFSPARSSKTLVSKYKFFILCPKTKRL